MTWRRGRILPTALLIIASVAAGGSAQEVVDLEHSGAGYPVYRIPALAVANDGTLLAAYDGRPSMADVPSNIALLVRRSRDGGRTWDPRQVVRADTAPLGFGDPSLLVDRATGRIFLFHAASVRRGFAGSAAGSSDSDPDVLHADLSWSDDHGLTWMHRRLTSAVKDPAWGGIFASSGSGIQLRGGRLLQPFVIRHRGANWAAALLSDDHGATWRMGGLAGPGADESEVAELEDGTLLLNSRAKPFRLVARSRDGGGSWGPFAPDTALADPANNAGLLALRGGAWLLLSHTADRERRVNLELRLSCDGGLTWAVGRTLVPGPAAYSTLALLPDGAVGVLFERGDYEAISFARVPVAWVGPCP